MERKSNEFIESLNNIKEEIIEHVKFLLKGNCIENINFQFYYENDYILNWTFYDCDEDGNGEGLECGMVEMENNDVVLTMYTTYGSYFGKKYLTDLSTTECLYFLHLIEDVFEVLEHDCSPILREGIKFEY